MIVSGPLIAGAVLLAVAVAAMIVLAAVRLEVGNPSDADDDDER